MGLRRLRILVKGLPEVSMGEEEGEPKPQKVSARALVGKLMG